MIKASIFRTDEKQIKEKGRKAWVDMMFTGSDMEAVKAYCEQLAAGDGIANPLIEVSEPFHYI